MVEQITQRPYPESYFYKYSKVQLEEKLSKEYIGFLEEADLVQWAKLDFLFIAKRLLEVDNNVRQVATLQGIKISKGYKGNVLANISQENAKNLLDQIGYIMPPTGIMYRLFIPDMEEKSNSCEETKETLRQMIKDYAELMIDRTLGQKTLRINNAQREIILPNHDGYFSKEDLNEFGYPEKVKLDNGEYRYLYDVNGDECGVIRISSEFDGLGMGINRPNIHNYSYNNRLGVRPIFFNEK